MKKRYERAVSIGWRILLILIFALLLKPKCQNVWFYKDGICHEYCADGDWSQVEFCKKRAVEGHWGAVSYGLSEAGWTCKKIQNFKEGKCTMKCFENDTPLTLTTASCDKVVY